MLITRICWTGTPKTCWFLCGTSPEESNPTLPSPTCSSTPARACLSAAPSIWDHVLGYWNASKESPETVLFLRYEEILLDPVGNVRKLARFVGQPLSPAEEEAGVAEDIARLCSFETLRGLEVNRAAGSGSLRYPNISYFRRGQAGDWANHMTPEMAGRLDAVMEEKLRGSGLSFA